MSEKSQHTINQEKELAYKEGFIAGHSEGRKLGYMDATSEIMIKLLEMTDKKKLSEIK